MLRRISTQCSLSIFRHTLVLVPLIEDRDGIIEVLKFTEKLFDFLIQRLNPVDRQFFQDAWSETRQTLDQQRALLGSITSEQHPMWSAIRRVGLTGKNLVMKLHYLAKAASGGWRRKLLDLLNKFLGSLASAVPGVEPIKELKEWLEGQIENDPDPEPAISSLYLSQSYSYFRERT